MSGVLGGGAKTNQAPTYTTIQLQTSAQGLPRPLVYGATKVGANLLWCDNFQATYHASQQAGKGGQTTASGSYTYKIDAILGVAEGPVTGIGMVWADQSATTLSELGLTVATGGVGQAVWGYLTTNYAGQAVPYSTQLYVAAQGLSLGTSASLPNFNFEVFGLLYGTAPNGYDADPSQIVPDLLTNPLHGANFPANMVGQMAAVSENHTAAASIQAAANFQYNLCVVNGAGVIFSCVPRNPAPHQYTVSATGLYGFNASDVGSAVTIRYASLSGLTNYQNYTLASGLWMSPAYTSQSPASTMLADIATYTNSEVVFSAGALNLAPRGTLTITANGYTYSAPQAPLFDLTDDDFQPNQGSGAVGGSTDDPVILSRSRPADQNNDIQIEVLERGNQYAAAVVEAQDQALITKFGRRSQGSKQVHQFADINAGYASAQLLLQREYIRNTYVFTLDERYCVLDPMDIVSITDATLGLVKQWVRVTEISENDDGTLTLSAEEYAAGTGAAAQYSVGVNSGYAPQQNVAPSSINVPVIFEPPIQLCQSNGLEVWVAVSGANAATWGGCNVFASLDGTTYEQVATIQGPSRMGVLTAALPSGSDPDTTNTLSVDLSESQGTLTGATTANADAAATICYVDGEYISYSTATLTAANHYDLTGYLRRGEYGSTIGAHPVETNFVRLDNTVARIPFASPSIGLVLHLKFQSFNVYGVATENQATLPVYTHTIGGPPNSFVVTSVAVTAGFRAATLNWMNPAKSATSLAAVQVWRNTVDNVTTATHIADCSYPATSYTDSTLDSGQTYYYWLRCVDVAGNPGPYTASVHTTTLALISNDIGAGIIANSMLNQDLSTKIALLPLLDPNNLSDPNSLASQMKAANDLINANYTTVEEQINNIQVSDPTAAINAAVSQEASARTSADSALSTSITNLSTNLANNYSTTTSMNLAISTATSATALNQIILNAVSGASYATQGWVNNAISTATTASALSSAVLSVVTGQNYATNTQLSTALSGISSSTSTWTSQLNSTVYGAGSTPSLQAQITTVNTTATNAASTANSANSTANAANSTANAAASSVSTLSTTVSGHTTSIQTLQTTVNGISGQYMVKIDANGYVSGYGLYNSGPGTSQFIVRADTFAIGAPGVSTALPFVVQNGVIQMNASQVQIANLVVGTAQIADLSVNGNKIQYGAVSNTATATGILATAYLTTHGYPVLVVVSAPSVYATQVGTTVQPGSITLYQDASRPNGQVGAVWTASTSSGFSMSWIVTPGAGSHSFQSYALSGGGYESASTIYVQELTK